MRAVSEYTVWQGLIQLEVDRCISTKVTREPAEGSGDRTTTGLHSSVLED